MIEILLADDHNIFREGLKKILQEQADMQVTGEASDGDQAMRAILKQPWHVVLLDVSMGGKSALEIILHARRVCPETPILMLTMHHDELLAMRFIKAGAKGYLTKDCDLAILIQAIRKVAGGGKYISPDLAERIVDELDTDLDTPLHTQLSQREFTVLCKIAAGTPIGRIAEQMSVSTSTASTYRRRTLKKLHLKNNYELTNYALKHNLVH